MELLLTIAIAHHGIIIELELVFTIELHVGIPNSMVFTKIISIVFELCP